MPKKKTRLQIIQASVGGENNLTTQAQSEAFTREVLEIQRTSNISLIEAIVAYCEKHNMEVEDSIAFLNQNLLSTLTKEAAGLKLLKRKYREEIIE